jgi:hypothetical protein
MMLKTIKKYLSIGTILLVFILVISTYTQYKKIVGLESELSVSKNNEKAFIAENNKLREDNIAFTFTIEQLNYFNDSLITKMNEVRKELRIKDDDLKQMQYLLTEARKTDTIVFKDTIFKDSTISIDTLIGDNWYNILLELEYPNTIKTTPTFISEKYIIVHNKKETIDPPKKCFISRLFQKKHTIVEVEVIEESPYIENKQQKFIKIIE